MKLSDDTVILLKSLGSLAALYLLIKLGVIKSLNFNVDSQKLLPDLSKDEDSSDK